ncbi:transposable element Tcb1 transposase [Trichonephila clavipes]|nr:transposable element Tcb1 transposase [Trichonephila clavipes]
MATQRNVYNFLQLHVLPLMQPLLGAIFQQENARPHTDRVSQDCLLTVTTLPWPTRSPKLSPMEHVWDHLGLRVGHPTSLNELEARVQQIWNEMSEDIIQNLYASINDRIVSCIRATSSQTLEMLKKAYKYYRSGTRVVSPLSRAENETEGTTFCRFRSCDPKCDKATEGPLKNLFQKCFE